MHRWLAGLFLQLGACIIGGCKFFFPLKFASPVFFQGQKRLFNGPLTPLANGFDGSVKLGMKVEVSVK